MVVETFAKRMRIVAQEIENSIQSQKIKANKSLATTCLKNSWVFQLDNESISGVDIPFDFITSIIALESQFQKQKHYITNSTQPSADAILMNNGFKKAAVVLADIYYSNVNTKNTELVLLVGQVEKKTDLIENSLRKIKDFLGDLKDTLRNMQEMIGGVLQVLARINVAARLGLFIGKATLY